MRDAPRDRPAGSEPRWRRVRRRLRTIPMHLILFLVATVTVPVWIVVAVVVDTIRWVARRRQGWVS